MATVVNMETIKKSSLKCTFCARKNIRLDAVKYCVECQSYCCQGCVETHATFPVLMGHTLLDSEACLDSAVAAKQPNKLPSLPTERCRKHPTKVVDMYCGNHDVVACSTCMTIDHRSCIHLHSIPDEIDSLYIVADFNQAKKDLKGSKSLIIEQLTKKAEMLIKLKQSKNKTKESIKDFKIKLEEDMKVILADLEEDAIKQLKLTYSRKKESISSSKTELEVQLSNVDEVNDKLSETDGNKTQEFVWTKFVQAKVLELGSMDSALWDDKVVELAFDHNRNFGTIFEQCKSFGDIHVHEVEVKSPRNTTYKVKNQYSIDLKLPDDDTQCCFEGSCVTPDGFLLITDYNNAKLKRVDITNSSFVDQCEMHSFPTGVCYVREKQVAVACVGSRTIRFVELGKQMTSTKQFNVEHSCFGIASDGQRCFVTDYGHSVYVYDMNGTVLNKVTKDGLGNSLFRNPRHIALSGQGNKLYVDNCDNSKGVTILDTEGKFLHSFKDPQMPMSYGVCADGRKNMFVCGHKTDNVIQMSLDGKIKGVILSASDGLHEPLSLSFHSSSNKLIVTEKENDEIKVFVLK